MITSQVERSRLSAAADTAPGSPADVSGRIERLPISGWHVKARVLIGTATFFDAFDALSIAQVLPVLVPLWKLSSGEVGFLIATGYLGQLLGALFFSAIAERFGRVNAMVASIATFTVMSIACGFASNYESLLVFRALQGFGLGGEVPIAAVYISEITKAHGRGRFVLLYELVFSVGVVAAGAIGYWVVPHLGWHYMFFIGAIPVLFVHIIYRWLPESPRWLASKGRYADADRSLSRIETQVEKSLGRPLPKPLNEQVKVSTEKRSSWMELFSRQYLVRTLVVWCIWFAAYLIYYGISTWLPTLYHTIFKLPLELSLRYGLISTAVGFVGATACALSIDRVGRKTWFALSLAGSGAFLLALWYSGATEPKHLLIYGSGAYFFATAAAIGVYLYTPELYPTRIRALGVGTATAWLRVASMTGPLVIGGLIKFGLNWVFLVFAGAALLVAVVVAVFAIETKERTLEELSP